MAYTKYSLTPANNTAAPPDGAPEGMLPSAVNDTMRDMMSQIRDVGDGVRDGTYTMTAPKITGGTITGVTLTGNTLTNPVITGATLTTSAFNGTVGATTASTGAFTTLSTSSTTTFSGLTASTALALDASKNVVSVTNTGTGNNVLSASPTLTGTTAGASLSLSSLTSGRVTYAGASGLLTDSVNLTFSGSVLSTPTLYPTASSGVGIQMASTGNNNGYWTIANNFGQMIVGTEGTAGSLVTGSSQGSALIGNAASNPLQFFTNNTVRATLTNTTLYTASGVNVGIGTSSPATKLNIENAGECQLQMAYSSTIFGRVGRLSSGNYEFSSYENGGSLLFGTTTSNGSTTERMRIDSSGNVGIGTSSPSAALSVIASPMVNQLLIGASTADSGYGSISFNGTSGATRIGFTGGGSGDPSLYYDAATAGIHQFRVNNAIKMVLDSSGNLLVGITTARANAGDVQVSKGISFPATQSAQSDANTLDDYEEGTWTPSQGAGLTVVGTFSSSGTYTKVGRLVTLRGSVSGSTTVALTANDTTICGNIPFTPIGSVPDRTVGGVINNTNTALAGVSAIGSFSILLNIGTIAATTDIHFSISYFA